MRKIFFITLIAAAFASGGAFFAFRYTKDVTIQTSDAICLAVLVPQLVAVWAFLTSLKVFKKELKIAYYLVTAGIVLLSVNQLQLGIAPFVNIDPILQSWLLTGCTLAGALLLYMGMHTFAHLLNLKVRFWGSFWLALSFSLVLAVVPSVLPHVEIPVSKWVVDGIFGTYMAAAGFAASAAVLAWHIRNKLAPSYKAAMNWLIVGLGVMAFASLHETLTKLLPVFAADSFAWYTAYGVFLWPLFVVALSFLGSSLSFRKIGQVFVQLSEKASYLDVVVNVAQLVSNPTAVDAILDEVRVISATKTSSDLSAEDKATLVEVYAQLEDYLTTKEQLLHITKEDLRTRLPDNFLKDLAGSPALLN